MKIDPKNLILINYSSKSLPTSVKEFKPAVFRDGDSYCCILGSDPQEGIFGCSQTMEGALVDWDKHFNDRMKEAKDGDPVTDYILDSRNTSKKDVW